MKLFNVFPVMKPKGNMFNLSHEKKLSLNMAELIPILCQDVVPGDRFTVNSEIFLRFAPMLAPIMHRVNVWVHYFFVPNRILWDSWEDFITGGADGTANPTFPTLQITEALKANYVAGSLGDYLGLPTTDGATVTQTLTFNRLPMAAYQCIWNEYYRDPNLVTEIDWKSTTNLHVLRTRCWEKDYFTSALPWSQRGGAVNLPLTGNIDFVPSYKNPALMPSGVNGNIQVTSGQIRDSTNVARAIDNLNSTSYDLTDVALTINDLRQSVKLQQWLENNARGGGRYIEQILAHFGVQSSDARLQRPEYLGGGKQAVQISEVLATADGASNDIGDMYGHGISVGSNNGFSKFFEEHGYIMGILSILPRTAYQQGVPKHFLYNDRYDFYFPEFANLGEQTVEKGELYWDWVNATNTATFGYQSRYAQYKYNPSTVHGAFRTSLTYWHLSRIFTSQPSLNQSFVEADPTHRAFIVTTPTVDKVYGQIYHNIKAWRPMPKYGIPIL